MAMTILVRQFGTHFVALWFKFGIRFLLDFH